MVVWVFSVDSLFLNFENLEKFAKSSIIFIPFIYILIQNQNQNSLLVKRQNDNTSPGLGRGRLVPSSHKGSEFRYAIVRQYPEQSSVIESFKVLFIFYARLSVTKATGCKAGPPCGAPPCPERFSPCPEQCLDWLLLVNCFQGRQIIGFNEYCYLIQVDFYS